MLKKLIPFLAAALLLIIAIAFDFSDRKSFSDESFAIEIGKNLERELTSLETEAQIIFKDSSHAIWSSLNHSFFLIENGKIINWNKNNLPIDVSDLEGDYQLKLLHSSRVDLILFQKHEGTKSLIGVIPLRTSYEIVNQYLAPKWNERIVPIDGVKLFSTSDNEGTAVCTSTHGCLFKMQIPTNPFVENKLSLVLVLFAILFALMGTLSIVRSQHEQKKYFSAFLTLFGSLATIRITMVQFLFPGRWIYSEFFDSKYFASSAFNASAGDFFLNALIVTIACAYLLKIYARLNFIKSSINRESTMRRVLAVFLLTASFFAFLFPHLFVEAIFHDSPISIDIASSVSFNGLRVVVLMALMFGCLSAIFIVHIFVRWAKWLMGATWQFSWCLALAALLFASYFLFSELNYWTTLTVGTAYFLLLCYSNYFHSLSNFSYRTFSFLLITVIALGAQGALGIWRFSEEKEIRSMFRSAGNLISRDVLGEYLLNEATIKIANDQFIMTSMVNPLLSKNGLRQKIKQVYLNNYFDRYEVAVKLYHPDGSPADRESETDFASPIKTFQNDANKTSYEGIYFIRNANAESVKRYIDVVHIKNKNKPLGFIVVDLTQKQIVPRQVYPELLVDSRFAQSLRNRNYSYAFFNQAKRVSSIGNFNFDRDFRTATLRNTLLYASGIRSNGYWLVGNEDESGKQAVVASEVYPFFFVLANFSFLFTLGVGLVFLLQVFFWMTQVQSKQRFNYSTRVQFYVYLAFILPLVAVSTIALRMIGQSDEAQLERGIREKGAQIAENISNAIEQSSDSLLVDSHLPDKLKEMAQATAVDANFYRPSGELFASSQSSVFENQLVMPLPDRTSWEKIINEKINVVQARCRIGLLEYNSTFFAIKSVSTGKIIGILELPFFKSTSETTKVSVLANILVTFTIVFLLFSFFAFQAMHKLTAPLRFIAKKLNMTSLGNNQPIEWKANDEIGLLVKEYNRMLEKLEQSKIDLSRSQKESAWREIAQQVAHEIKNPLTPMKLTLQQMEQRMMNESVADDRTKKSVQTLLAQVEILNGIAGSFSAFAAMPAPLMQRVEVTALLKDTISLFENQSEGNVNFEEPATLIFVQGDEKLLRRIFANIILNGLQAATKERLVHVEINLNYESDFCTVCFRDDGTGIRPDQLDKIFLPHFSTKQTGSGLGLAIAKQGIEHMGGSIWFETTEGEGSTFFVKLRVE